MSAISLFAFVTAALIGLTMAVLHFRGIKSGKALGLAHGTIALSGIAMLAVGMWMREASAAWWIVGSFGVVALGGIYLFSRQVRDEPWPALVIIAHGGLAIATIVALGLWVGGRETPDAEVPVTSQETTQAPTPS